MSKEYIVIVGNIGTVYSGTDPMKAQSSYAEYVGQSVSGIGRASGEDVTLMCDGDEIQSHSGSSNDDIETGE